MASETPKSKRIKASNIDLISTVKHDRLYCALDRSGRVEMYFAERDVDLDGYWHVVREALLAHDEWFVKRDFKMLPFRCVFGTDQPYYNKRMDPNERLIHRVVLVRIVDNSDAVSRKTMIHALCDKMNAMARKTPIGQTRSDDQYVVATSFDQTSDPPVKLGNVLMDMHVVLLLPKMYSNVTNNWAKMNPEECLLFWDNGRVSYARALTIGTSSGPVNICAISKSTLSALNGQKPEATDVAPEQNEPAAPVTPQKRKHNIAN